MKTVDDALAYADTFDSPANKHMSIVMLAAEVRRLRDEVDQLRCQLAGCGVAALENTVDSRSLRAVRGDYGYSASYEDVCNAVDREIALREENERLRENAKIISELEQLAARSNNDLLVENERLRNRLLLALSALKDAREMVEDWGGYASAYFQEKHDIDGDLKKLDESIAKAESKS